MDKPSAFERFNLWVRRSVTIKLISIGFLILILLIPTSMLTSLIEERQSLYDSATNDISSKWGGQQTIGGPVITIPYYANIKDDKGNVETVKRYAHFLPEQLNITGKVFPEKRYRGIYVVVLYKTIFNVSGKFSYPDVALAGLSPQNCLFNEAFISFGLSDLRGINENVNCRLNESVISFGPGIPTHDIFSSGLSSRINLGNAGPLTFSFDVNLNGSSNLDFLPFGKETSVSIQSPWNSPSFEGSFLPDRHTISDSGFTANWKVLQLNRNYPQQGLGNFIGGADSNTNDTYSQSGISSSFGVKLLLPVDEYQKNIRSVKYCLMFIILTFLTFFFVEILNKKEFILYSTC